MWQQNHRALGTYVNNDDNNVIKSNNMISNLKQNRQKVQDTERQKTSFSKRVAKKCIYKTYINPYGTK